MNGQYSYLKIRQPKSHREERFASLEDYQRLWQESVENPESFYGRHANELISWNKQYERVLTEGGPCQRDGTVKMPTWFAGGKLNACYNAVDRHANVAPDAAAILFEPEMKDTVRVSYGELLDRVSRLSSALRTKLGVKRGDTVTICLPMLPDAIAAMLACARIGAVHSVVFSGFSANALASRILDSESRVLITANHYSRAGKHFDLLARARNAVHAANQTKKDADLSSPLVLHMVVLDNKFTYTVPDSFTGRSTSYGDISSIPSPPAMVPVPESPDGTMEHDFDQLCQEASPTCEPEQMDSDDPLFVLYTSGSTGKPKGLLHSTAGYLLHAMLTTRCSFDMRGVIDNPDATPDVIANTSDVGWITGHTYCVYGPLGLGSTVLIFGAPASYGTMVPSDKKTAETLGNGYLNLWGLVARNNSNVLYTSPTVLRVLRGRGEEELMRIEAHREALEQHLRIFGSVGEPIDPATWMWLYKDVGNKKIPVIDTYWQTEGGGHMLAPVPFLTRLVPGSANTSCLGLQAVLVHPETGDAIPESTTEGKHGVLCFKGHWPGLARTVLNDHGRFSRSYFPEVKQQNINSSREMLFWTGDLAQRDKNGNFFVVGRCDDVINVSGHRLSTAEIESAVVIKGGPARESAVVARDHHIYNQEIVAYVVPASIENDVDFDKQDFCHVMTAVQSCVRSKIGSIAVPKIIIPVPALPKTRSGKIIRRVLRKIASKDTKELGDLCTMEDPTIIETLIRLTARATHLA